MVEGELVVRPHKTWGREKVPHHGHEGIHPISFKPLVWGDIRWFKWLFALRYAEGYSSPKSFLFNKGGAKNLCRTCLTFHNTSVHGYIAFCDNSSLLVRCWGEAWHMFKDKALQWRNRACFRKRILLGKLFPSRGLFDYMPKLLGFREAKSILSTFQKNIADKI